MYSSVWLRPERPPRDRRLSRGRIVDVAIAILDAEGHPGLSMRRVAAELGVTAGSLYWYVANKSQLMELAMDRVLGEVPAPSGDEPWRQALGGLARSHRRMLLRHPWVLSPLSAGPNLGPNALRLADAGLRLLAAAGLRGAELDSALAAVNDQVIGSAAAEKAWGAVVRHDWQEQAADYLREIRERHPLLGERLAAAGAPDVGPDIEEVSERRFEFALGCLLDGLAARIEH